MVALHTNRSAYNIDDAAQESMTVGELIDHLSHYRADDKVIFSNDGGYTYGYINKRTITSI